MIEEVKRRLILSVWKSVENSVTRGLGVAIKSLGLIENLATEDKAKTCTTEVLEEFSSFVQHRESFDTELSTNGSIKYTGYIVGEGYFGINAAGMISNRRVYVIYTGKHYIFTTIPSKWKYENLFLNKVRMSGRLGKNEKINKHIADTYENVYFCNYPRVL